MPSCAELSRDLESLRKEVGELRNSVAMSNDIFETMKSKQESLVKENKELSRTNEQLTKQVAELQQYSRMNNVEIKGIPETKS